MRVNAPFSSGDRSARERPVLLVGLHRNFLPEINRQTGVQRQKAVTSVLADDEIGRKAVFRPARENDARIGPEPHAEKNAGPAIAAQSQTAAPVFFSIAEAGNHCPEPLRHEAAANSGDQDAANRQQNESRQRKSRGSAGISMACSPQPADTRGEHRDHRRDIGRARIADDQSVAGDDCGAEHRQKCERAWPQQADNQKRKSHGDVGTDVAATYMHAGEGTDDTVTGREVEKTGEDGALGQDRRGDECKTCRHACAQPSHRVAVRTHSRAQKRQQCERSKKALGEPQCIVGT